MEQAKEKLKADLNLLEKSLKTLKEALQEEKTDLNRDATIQRFEYVFELAWKTIQGAARYVGTTCHSPREAIRCGYQMEWIKNTDAWFEALEARNQTSHTYNENLANEVYEVARKYPPLVSELTRSLKKVL